MLARRLASFAPLSANEVEAVADLTSSGIERTVAARRDLIREGEPTRAVFLIKSGWACRYKALEDGRRQILGFLLPGDLCDLNNFILREMDHSIGTITSVTTAEIGHDALERIGRAFPRIAQALWWQMLTTISVQREWTLSLGLRRAAERIGHLFCETFARLEAVGLTQGDQCDLPITQHDIAEATGLTSVHVNRTLQEMRARGLLTLRGRTLHVPELQALQELVMFNPAYLHLDREGKNLPERMLGLGVTVP